MALRYGVCIFFYSFTSSWRCKTRAEIPSTWFLMFQSAGFHPRFFFPPLLPFNLSATGGSYHERKADLGQVAAPFHCEHVGKLNRPKSPKEVGRKVDGWGWWLVESKLSRLRDRRNDEGEKGGGGKGALIFNLHTRKPNMSSKKGPFQKERIVFQPSFFRGHSLVFGGCTIFPFSNNNNNNNNNNEAIFTFALQELVGWFRRKSQVLGGEVWLLPWSPLYLHGFGVRLRLRSLPFMGFDCMSWRRSWLTRGTR